MNRMISRTARLAMAGFYLALAACGPSAPQDKVEVAEAWVRLPPVAGRPGAAYFTLSNHGPAKALVAVTSPLVERIELHDNQMAEGMMRMTPLTAVDLPENGSVAFSPGGKHAMLFGIDPAVKVGDPIQLSFVLRDGKKIEAQAQVIAAGAAPPHPH